MNHRLVKAVEVREEIIGVIDETPLTTGVFVTPSVAFAREVNPLRMAELIAHERQISAVDGGGGDETNHLMQRDAAVRHEGGMTVLEMPVHVGIDETEDDGLVAHQRLVVTLCV